MKSSNVFSVVAELHVTVKFIKILSTAQKLFYCEFVSSGTPYVGLYVSDGSCTEAKERSFAHGLL
jgi:hypothetical protein